MTALHVAARNDHSEIVKLLLQDARLSDINAQDNVRVIFYDFDILVGLC